MVFALLGVNKVVGFGTPLELHFDPSRGDVKSDEKMKKRDTGRKNEEKSENIAWFTLKNQLGTAVPSCFLKLLFFIWSSITSSHNTNQNRPLFKSSEKPNGKRQILSHQRDAKRLKIVEEDDEIVEKQLPTAVGSCFSKTTLLCTDF